MIVDRYKLYCDKCEYVAMPKEDVIVTVNLGTDRYEFRAICPKCGNTIYNTRPF